MTMETYQLSTKHTKCNLLFPCTSYLSSLQLVLQQGEEGLLRKPLLSQVGLSEVPRERDQLVLAEGRYLNDVRKMMGVFGPPPPSLSLRQLFSSIVCHWATPFLIEDIT